MFWLEAVLPLGIIAGMLCVMGNAQYYIYKAANGRPKHIGNDMWDVAMERRDKKIMEMLSAKQGQGKYIKIVDDFIERFLPMLNLRVPLKPLDFVYKE